MDEGNCCGIPELVAWLFVLSGELRLRGRHGWLDSARIYCSWVG